MNSRKNGVSSTRKAKTKIKPLFIGFGKQALEYARVMDYYNIGIESVCVRNLNKDQKKIDKYKIKNRYIDIEKALNDKKFNCVFVFLPWNVIEKKIFKIIKLTKKPIFVEKPIALSSKKLSQICKISDKFNKKVFVLYNRRYFQSVEFLKNKLKNKKPLFKIFIPEKKNFLIKNFDSRLKKNIRFHLTSHWIDFFSYLFNKKILGFQKINGQYFFYFSKNKKINYIKLEYDAPGFIESKIKISKKKYYFNKLEYLYEFKDNKFKLLINENRSNQFKPGIKRLIYSLKYKKRLIIPKVNQLKKLYFFLEKLPY